jgi:hypothetical protein
LRYAARWSRCGTPARALNQIWPRSTGRSPGRERTCNERCTSGGLLHTPIELNAGPRVLINLDDPVGRLRPGRHHLDHKKHMLGPRGGEVDGLRPVHRHVRATVVQRHILEPDVEVGVRVPVRARGNVQGQRPPSGLVSTTPQRDRLRGQPLGRHDAAPGPAPGPVRPATPHQPDMPKLIGDLRRRGCNNWDR